MQMMMRNEDMRTTVDVNFNEDSDKDENANKIKM